MHSRHNGTEAYLDPHIIYKLSIQRVFGPHIIYKFSIQAKYS